MRESSTDEIEQLGVGRTVRLIVKRAGQTRTLDAEIIDISSTDGGRMPPLQPFFGNLRSAKSWKLAATMFSVARPRS